jgi:hypothetical protein
MHAEVQRMALLVMLREAGGKKNEIVFTTCFRRLQNRSRFLFQMLCNYRNMKKTLRVFKIEILTIFLPLVRGFHPRPILSHPFGVY